MLTNAGQQLARICEAEPIDGVADYLINKWKSLGYETTRVEIAA